MSWMPTGTLMRTIRRDWRATSLKAPSPDSGNLPPNWCLLVMTSLWRGSRLSGWVQWETMCNMNRSLIHPTALERAVSDFVNFFRNWWRQPWSSWSWRRWNLEASRVNCWVSRWFSCTRSSRNSMESSPTKPTTVWTQAAMYESITLICWMESLRTKMIVVRNYFFSSFFCRNFWTTIRFSWTKSVTLTGDLPPLYARDSTIVPVLNQCLRYHKFDMFRKIFDCILENYLKYFNKYAQSLIWFIAFQLLDIMGSLLDRELIKKDFDEKYPLIVKMMDKELDVAKSVYDDQMASKKENGKAVLHKNMPKVSGSLRWAQELRERISAPMGNFKSLEHRYCFILLVHF